LCKLRIKAEGGEMIRNRADAERSSMCRNVYKSSIASRFLPLRFRWQPIPVRGPIRCGQCRARPHDHSGHRVNRRQPLALAARITPLHDIRPSYAVHWMIRSLASTCRQARVAIAQTPCPDLVPLRFRRLFLLHVKRAYIHRHRGALLSVSPLVRPILKLPSGIKETPSSAVTRKCISLL
jgi:hypothetical protein